MITAAIAGDLFIVLPGLIEASRTLLDRLDPGSAEPARLTEVIVPASFNFPHTGKLLSLSFILFAGWFADAVVPIVGVSAAGTGGLVSFFGSLTAAVPFLLDLFRIPADTFQLFLATGVINSRVGSLVAAVHTIAVALLATCAITGHLHWQRAPLLRYAGITVTLVIMRDRRHADAVRDGALAGVLERCGAGVDAAARRSGRGDALDHAVARTGHSLPPLETIRERGVLRVGYLPDALPFAFVNQAGDLVGFDIELAHDLARELGVTLAFVPVDRDTMAAQLDAGYSDLVMSGVVVTTERARELLLSDSYLDETVAFCRAGPPARAILQLGRDSGATPGDDRGRGRTVLPAQAARAAAARRITTQHDLGAWFGRGAEAGALALPAERGSAWTLRYPAYSVVVPGPDLIRVPLAYPIGKRDDALARFVNTWIALKRKDGTLDAAYRHWILGHDAAPDRPRWSILRDVLHWVE